MGRSHNIPRTSSLRSSMDWEPVGATSAGRVSRLSEPWSHLTMTSSYSKSQHGVTRAYFDPIRESVDMEGGSAQVFSDNFGSSDTYVNSTPSSSAVFPCNSERYLTDASASYLRADVPHSQTQRDQDEIQGTDLHGPSSSAQTSDTPQYFIALDTAMEEAHPDILEGSDTRLQTPSPSLSTIETTPPDDPQVLNCLFEGCSAGFHGKYRRGNQQRHMRLKHGHVERLYHCEDCPRTFKRQDARLKHYRSCHPDLARTLLPPQK